ncbi:MAG: MFS transporter [Rhodospirillaceae bacterium]|nr:MAG: MFS transporter [Rhodospirillaceae bacterium]
MSDSSEPVRPAPRSVIMPLTVAGGLFMEGLDSTIIATSLPQMARSLEVSPTYLSLAITSYLLSLAVFTPISGWLADRFGGRRLYCFAIAAFTVSSALCALSPNLEFLVATRILQGVAGALMAPVARLILLRSFPKSDYIKATNYMVMPALIGPMAGPVVGGFITEYFSWRWIFLINIPIGIASIHLILRLVQEVPARRPPPFDFPGFVIVGAGFAMAQFWLECVGRNIIAVSAQIVLFAGSVAAFFGYRQYARGHPNPALDLKLFSIPSFSISVLWGSVARMGIGASPFLLPLLFQVGFGFDPFHAGILMFVSTSGAFFMRVGFSRVIRIWGLRRVLVLNSAILAVMLPGFILFHAATSHWLLVSYVFLFGFMRSIQFLSLSLLSYADLTVETISKGTSIFTVGQRLSMGAGVAVAGGLLTIFASGNAKIMETDFHPVFAILGLFELIALWGFWRLHPMAGREITGA